MRSFVFVLILNTAALCYGAIDTQKINEAVNAFASINNAPSYGKLMKHACSVDEKVKGMMKKLKDVKPTGLACFYDATCSFKSEIQQDNVDITKLMSKVSSGVIQKCSQSMSQVAPVMTEATSMMNMSPSSLLLNVKGLPKSAINAMDKGAQLMKSIKDDPSLINKKAAFGKRCKAVFTPLIKMSAADRQKIVAAIPESAPFLTGAKKQQYTSMLNSIMKSCSKNLPAAEQKALETNAKMLCEAMVDASTNNFLKTVKSIDSLSITPAVQSDPDISSAVQVIAPFMAQKNKAVLDKGTEKLANGLIDIAQQFVELCGKSPNPFVTYSNTLTNNLPYRIKINWDAIPLCP